MRNPAAYLLVLLTLGVVSAGAGTAGLTAQDAWVRATPGTDVAATYLTLHNAGARAVTVIGVRSPLAAAAMIHQTRLVGRQYSMRPHEQLRIAPGETVRFAPGGLHLMLMRLAHPLQPGEQVPLVLLLDGGGTLALTARVLALGEE